MDDLKSKNQGFQKVDERNIINMSEFQRRKALQNYIHAYDELEKKYYSIQKDTEKFRQNNDVLQEAFNNAVKEKNKLKDENEELKALRKEKAAIEKEKARIEKDKTIVKVFQDFINENFPNGISDIKRLAADKKYLEGKNKELQDKIDNAKKDVSKALEGQNDKFNTERKQLNDEICKLEKDIENLNIEINNLKNDNDSLNQKLLSSAPVNNGYSNANNTNNYNNYSNNNQQPNRQPPNSYDRELESLNKGEQDYFLRIYRDASYLEYEQNIEYMDIVINFSDTVGFFVSGNYKLAHVVLSTLTGIVIVNPYFFNIISEAHQYSEELAKLSSVFDYNIVPNNYKNYQIIGIKPAKVRQYDDKFILYQKGKVWFAEK